jgi:hypothetical protein
MGNDLVAMSSKYTTYGVDFYKLERYKIRLNKINNNINQEIGTNTFVIKSIQEAFPNGKAMPSRTRNEYNRLLVSNKTLNGYNTYIESEIEWINYVYKQEHRFGDVVYGG